MVCLRVSCAAATRAGFPETSAHARRAGQGSRKMWSAEAGRSLGGEPTGETPELRFAPDHADLQRREVGARDGWCIIRSPQEENEMTLKNQAARFAELHAKGNPVILYNAWDAGSAKVIASSGAKAIATGSWSVAAAQGYEDGEDMPKDFAERVVARIVASVGVPVTVDFEGGYSEDDAELAENVSRLIDAGGVGINFEDRVVKGDGLYAIDRQAKRIAAIRQAAEKKASGFFINARTDLFLRRGDADPSKSIGAALDRAKAYAAAGASGFFIPGLQQSALIEEIVNGVSLPVNVMVMDGVPSNTRLALLGVARISYGPIPYAKAMKSLGDSARKVLSYSSE